MLRAPVALCDTAAIAAAVFSSSLSLGTSETALVITLTRWPCSSSEPALMGLTLKQYVGLFDHAIPDGHSYSE